MPEDFVQLAVDGTGKKLRARRRDVLIQGTPTAVFETANFAAAAETWSVFVSPGVFALNKHHLTLYNAAGSGVVCRMRKLFATNLQTAAVVGVVCRFDCMRISAAPTGGTTVAPVAHDTTNAALPAGLTVRHSGVVTDGPVLWPWMTQTDEETAVPALSKGIFQQSVNILPEGLEVQEVVCREGQGFSVKQITSTTIGTYGWLLVFTVEAP